MEEIIEGNCLIADFMGMERTGKETGEPTFKQGKNAVIWASQLQYHSSFDCLMPVVEKIQTLGYTVSIWCEGDARDNRIWNYCNIFDKDENLIIGGVHDRSKINAIYESVESFIRWYNQTQITNNPSPLK